MSGIAKAWIQCANLDKVSSQVHLRLKSLLACLAWYRGLTETTRLVLSASCTWNPYIFVRNWCVSVSQESTDFPFFAQCKNMWRWLNIACHRFDWAARTNLDNRLISAQAEQEDSIKNVCPKSGTPLFNPKLDFFLSNFLWNKGMGLDLFHPNNSPKKHETNAWAGPWFQKCSVGNMWWHMGNIRSITEKVSAASPVVVLFYSGEFGMHGGSKASLNNRQRFIMGNLPQSQNWDSIG